MSDREPAPSTRFLYRAAHQGDREALESLLERMRPRLAAWIALNMGQELKARVDAEDLVQEILLKAANSIDTFEPRGRRPFYGWLFAIARNQIREWHRNLRAAKRDLRRDEAVHSGIDAQRTGPFTHAARADEVGRVLEAMARLPEKHRDIVRMRRIEFLDNAEAAEKLGITPKNAAVRYVRAMQALREEINRNGDL